MTNEPRPPFKTSAPPPPDCVTIPLVDFATMHEQIGAARVALASVRAHLPTSLIDSLVQHDLMVAED